MQGEKILVEEKSAPNDIFDHKEESKSLEQSPIPEPRNLSMREQTTPKREKNIGEVLEIEDQISDPETVKFWKRYFEEDYNSNFRDQIQIDDFCNAIYQEFYDILIYGFLSEHDLDEDALIQELNNLLRGKVSLDEEYVSHNALELFTRDTGLQSSLY